MTDFLAEIDITRSAIQASVIAFGGYRQAARELGIPKSTISDAMTGRREVSVGTLIKLYDGLRRVGESDPRLEKVRDYQRYLNAQDGDKKKLADELLKAKKKFERDLKKDPFAEKPEALKNYEKWKKDFDEQDDKYRRPVKWGTTTPEDDALQDGLFSDD